MTKFYDILLLAYILFAYPKAYSEVSGSFKSHVISGNQVTIDGAFETENSYAVTSRINSLDWINPSIYLESAYSLSLQYSKENEPVPYFESLSYRIYDLNREITRSLQSDNLFGIQNLDRFVLVYGGRSYDLYMGRQAISFGSSKFSNPIDVFLPYPIGAIDSEYRSGIDAIRVRKPLGDFSELDFGVFFGKEAKEESSGVYVSTNMLIKENELLLIAAKYRNNVIYGLDFQGSIFSQGLTFEISQNEMKEIDGLSQDYIRYAVGVNAKFSDELFAIFEYHYNGSGETDKQNYPLNFTKLSHLEGGVYFMAQRYFASLLSYQFTPLANIALNIINNLDDQSIYSFAAFDYSLKDNLFISASINSFSGASDSEYGARKGASTLSLKYYF